MGKTWRKERYESDEGSSRSFAKSQKRCWVEEDEGYIQKIIDEIWYKPPEYEDEEVGNNK
jgi:hypothetical protein